MQTKSRALAFKSTGISSDGTFTGLGSTFGNVDLGGDIVMPGAFRASLNKHRDEGTAPAMLWAHDLAEPIGRWLSVTENDVGLSVKGKLSLGVARAKAAYSLMRDGALGLSIGYLVAKADYDDRGVRLIREVELFEVSPVAIPMNPKAQITAVKSLSGIRDYETLLRDELGCSVREARKLASGGWNALTKSNDDSDELAEISHLIGDLSLRFVAEEKQ